MVYLLTACWLILVHVLACMYVFKGGPSNSNPSNPESKEVEGFARDLVAAKRVADYLRWSGEISVKQFQLITVLLREAKIKGLMPTVKSSAEQEASPANDVPLSSTPIPGAKSSDELLMAGKANKDVAGTAVLTDKPAPDEPTVVVPNTPALPIQEPVLNLAKEIAKPAPWDLPDPPPREPRRTFSEVMSTFMHDKNMRWGELASGIMIVLSAVGLVMSLRETLENTIPYFSTLLFMLITAAIHGAGIYTLKKWKLRNTSRGTLVIGLLLVPINFAMACLLSEHRPLSDPWFWVALITGVCVFSFITWHSSKALLRRGNLPMVIAVLGCGLGTLFLNRTIELDLPNVFPTLFALPILACFLVGSCAFDSRQWDRRHWTVSAESRLWLFFGIASASAISALSAVSYTHQTLPTKRIV